MYRYYTCLKRDSGLKKRVRWFDGLPEQRLNRKHITVVEYMGNYNEMTLPHGNSKVSTQGYAQTNPEVLNIYYKKGNTKSGEMYIPK